MKQVLLQLTIDDEKRELQIGLAEGIKNESTKEYILATMELIGNKILQELENDRSS